MGTRKEVKLLLAATECNLWYNWNDQINYVYICDGLWELMVVDSMLPRTNVYNWMKLMVDIYLPSDSSVRMDKQMQFSIRGISLSMRRYIIIIVDQFGENRYNQDRCKTKRIYTKLSISYSDRGKKIIRNSLSAYELSFISHACMVSSLVNVRPNEIIAWFIPKLYIYIYMPTSDIFLLAHSSPKRKLSQNTEWMIMKRR